jgi:RNA polymerase sigma-70 factor (ECF subfamily)
VINLNEREISAEILEACRRGDREAFRVLYETYKDRVFSIALHYSRGDRAAAGDMTQQAFLKLFSSLPRFRGESLFSTWLYRCVVNACIDWSRSKAGQAVATDPVVLERLPATGSQEDGVVRAQLEKSIQAAVAALPPALRLPILLRYFEELSYEEIAGALGCSAGTVASRLNRGHRLLARKLAPMREALLGGKP